MSRQLSERDLAYEAIAQRWSGVISDFDTRRRLEVLLHDLLPEGAIRGRRALEVGCGLGYFTQEILRHEPRTMTSLDIAPTLVEQLKARLPIVDCRVADAMDLGATLGTEQFDFILSSEVIEHTPDPRRAIREMAKHLAPGGRLIVSVPNRRWRWLLTLATMAGARKHYQGYENWVRPAELTEWAEAEGLEVVAKSGIHTVPWHLSESLTAGLDRRAGGRNYPVAVNLAIVAVRPS